MEISGGWKPESYASIPWKRTPTAVGLWQPWAVSPQGRIGTVLCTSPSYPERCPKEQRNKGATATFVLLFLKRTGLHKARLSYGQAEQNYFCIHNCTRQGTSLALRAGKGYFISQSKLTEKPTGEKLFLLEARQRGLQGCAQPPGPHEELQTARHRATQVAPFMAS